MPDDDAKFVLRAQSGDVIAFDRLFALHRDGVYACLWHLLGGNAELIEEAIGNVFLSAYRNLKRFRSESAVSTWLYRIAINEARARIRHEKRWTLSHRAASSVDALNRADGHTLDSQLIAEEEHLRLWRTVRGLPEPYRTPIVLRYMSGLTSQEIASTLRRPGGTVRYQLSRGLQMLRERLGEGWN